MPRAFISVAAVLTLLGLIPIALLVKARVTDSPTPRTMVVYDMDDQQKAKTQRTSPLFEDGRIMRTAPEGAVARDEVVGNPALTEGRIDTTWVEAFPVTVDRVLLERGRERFGIYCAVCHGHDGSGDGPVHRRAMTLAEGTWTPPTDLASQAVVDRPLGHLYNTIRSGIRKMPAYGPQIPVEDRWAIVAYVRALQLSAGAARPSDLIAEDREALAAAAD